MRKMILKPAGRIRLLAAAALLLMLLLFTGAGLLATRASQDQASQNGASEPGIVSAVRIGGPFRLTDTTGRTVTEADFIGRYTLLYFGYTFCPDICPTELGAMAAAIDMLAPEQAARVTPVMITIDPERDTPEVMARYVQHFHPGMAGLTGTPARIAEVARQYRVFYRKVDDPDHGYYLVDHSSFIYLMGPDGQMRNMFPYGTNPADMATTIQTLITG